MFLITESDERIPAPEVYVYVSKISVDSTNIRSFMSTVHFGSRPEYTLAEPENRYKLPANYPWECCELPRFQPRG